jgi:hypothetical protein
MKINRFVAMAAIALLVVGAMGAISMKAFAKGSQAPVTQADACAQEQADGAEVTSATDTDTVDLQCGDQNEADTSVSATAEQGATVGAADTDTAQVEEQVGDQSGADTGVEAPEAATPSGK